MKKVFVLFGIAAFSGVSAQQKDLFDIQQHLQKKQVEVKKSAEKRTYTLPFFKQFNYKNLYSENNAGSNYTLPNGDVVFTSPIDRMPCVRPNMNNFQVMPNLADGKPLSSYNYYPDKFLPGQIPNGSLSYRMKASK